MEVLKLFNLQLLSIYLLNLQLDNVAKICIIFKKKVMLELIK